MRWPRPVTLADGPYLHDENMTALAGESPGETPLGQAPVAGDAALRCELSELDWALERI